MRRKRTRTALLSLGMALAFVLTLGGPSLCSAAAGTDRTIWGWGTPAGVDSATDDSASVELGTAFTVKVDGEIAGVRFWQTGAAPAVGQTGSLWTAGGERLATATFPSSTGSGWQSAYFASPVEVKASESLVASYHAPHGQYAVTENYTGTSAAAEIVIPRANAGRYDYGSSSSFPDRTYKSSNYWVTPVLRPSQTAAPAPPSPSPSPSPSPTSSSPTSPASPTSGSVPGPTTTGLPLGTVLRQVASLRVTQANTVISGLDIAGGISIEAPGVVIEKSRIRGSGSANAVQVRSGSVTIKDSEIYGAENGIGGDDWQAYRVNIHSTSGDGVKLGSDTVLADSWIHDLTPDSDAHADGIQVQSGVVNAVVRNNVIDMSTTRSANSAMFVAPDLGPSSKGPLLVEGNYFDGGNFTVQVVDGNDGEYFIDDIAFRNNSWGRKSSYGPVRTNVPVTWVNNTYADTGAVIRP